MLRLMSSRLCCAITSSILLVAGLNWFPVVVHLRDIAIAALADAAAVTLAQDHLQPPTHAPAVDAVCMCTGAGAPAAHHSTCSPRPTPSHTPLALNCILTNRFVCCLLCVCIQVLVHLKDIRNVSLTGEDAGSFKLEFHFGDNPFFANKVRRAYLSGKTGLVQPAWHNAAGLMYCSRLDTMQPAWPAACGTNPASD
jgi:hypothetical protein